MGELFFDFDAAIAERTTEPLVVRAFGEDHTLPADMPALFALFYARLQARTDLGSYVEVEADLAPVYAALFGPGALDRFIAGGASFEQLGGLLGAVRGQYAARDAEGKPAAPKKGASRSPKSSTGSRSSKPTSKRTTASRSSKRSTKA